MQEAPVPTSRHRGRGKILRVEEEGASEEEGRGDAATAAGTAPKAACAEMSANAEA
jgi:hypothetical protein